MALRQLISVNQVSCIIFIESKHWQPEKSNGNEELPTHTLPVLELKGDFVAFPPTVIRGNNYQIWMEEVEHLHLILANVFLVMKEQCEG